MNAHHAESHNSGHHDHDDAEDIKGMHVTLSHYVIGFVLSVVLTAIPFACVGFGLIENPVLLKLTLLFFAVVQIFVHMVYFLHMNTHSEGGWNFLALMFTGIIVFITLVGSIWVMSHLNANMMPDMNHEILQNIQKGIE